MKKIRFIFLVVAVFFCLINNVLAVIKIQPSQDAEKNSTRVVIKHNAAYYCSIAGGTIYLTPTQCPITLKPATANGILRVNDYLHTHEFKIYYNGKDGYYIIEFWDQHGTRHCVEVNNPDPRFHYTITG